MTTRTQERGLNWTLEERAFLVGLIEAKKDVIENKQSDYASVHERNQAWLDIAEEYNTTYPPGREPQKIKEQYQRLKSNAKKEMMEYHRKASLRPPASPPSEMTLRLSMLAPGDFKPNSCCWETESKASSSMTAASSELNNISAGEEGSNGPPHMLVTPKTEVDSDGGGIWESAETFHVVANGGVSRRHSELTESSNDDFTGRSSWRQDLPHTSPRNLERTRAYEPTIRKKALSVLERMSADRLNLQITEIEKEQPVAKRKKLSTTDSQQKESKVIHDPLYKFHKEEHDLKMRHLNAEHSLRMQILTLKKQLLEKKIAALDSKHSESSMKS